MKTAQNEAIFPKRLKYKHFSSKQEFVFKDER